MDGFWVNLPLVLLCYAYILLCILLAGCLKERALSPSGARKLLHILIGNLPLVMPYFTMRLYPVVVAGSFIPITYLVSPISGSNWLKRRMNGLSILSGEGHGTGLILYAVSYTVLAALYGGSPPVVASGILPMAYGDSFAALVGSRFGRHRVGSKSLEGSAAMFAMSVASLTVGMAYFAPIYGLSLWDLLPSIVAVSALATVVELLSPSSLDNLLVPLLCATAFKLLGGAS